jgi:hypothetical protein
MARLSRIRLCIAGLALGAPLVLSACSGGQGVSEARQACTYVDKALATFKASQVPTLDPNEAQTLRNTAQDELLKALPYAAKATSSNGSYNALMTNIQEANRVPMDLLVPSLTRQCEVVKSNTPYLGS